VTTPTNIARLISLTTQRSRAVSPALTFVSVITPIRSTYLVNTPNFVACHVQAYLRMYDVTRGLRKNGTFLLNTVWDEEELARICLIRYKKYFAKNNIYTVYYINATQIAQEIGLGNRTNTILQSAFFRITNVIPVDLAVEQMKKFIVKSLR
jgi:pyruvate-ferredoxin/flavodoxin oxidoreductase